MWRASIIEFIDLKKQYTSIKEDVDNSISRVLNASNFVQGKEVKDLESVLSNFVGAKCVTCANGTDALFIALKALNIKPGDEVIVPSFTWVSTAEVVKMVGAEPIFIDIGKDFNLNQDLLENVFTKKTKAVIAVSMFGLCAELEKIMEFCETKNIFLIEDGAQSFGAMHNNKMSCSIAHISTTSFFPAKPLGCYGDGGALFTNDESLFNKIDAISKHGQKGRYNYIEVGVNSRLDTLQAAILLEKFKIFEDEISIKNDIAKQYNEILKSSHTITTPFIPNNENRSVWAQYTILLDDSASVSRDEIMDKLKNRGIPSALYYPQPLHLVDLYAENKISLPVTENFAKRVLSLPMHAYLSKGEINHVAESLLEFYN